MRTKLFNVFASLYLLSSILATAQPAVPPPKTTAFTRGLIGTNTTSAEFRAALGFLSTNNTVITNYEGNGASITNLNASELRSGTVPLARLTGITASQVADATLTTNKVDATFHALLGGGGGSGDVTSAQLISSTNLVVQGLAAGSYAIGGWSTNVLFVAKNGSDSTGTGSYLQPYLTLTNAKQQAVAGQTIHVFPGLYTNQNNLAKNGVNWNYESGATNLYIQTTTNDAGWGIYDDRTVSGGCKMTLSGNGSFIFIGVSNIAAFYDDVEDPGIFSGNPNTVGVFVQTNAASFMNFTADFLSLAQFNNEGPVHQAYIYRGSSNLKIKCSTNMLQGITYTSGSAVASSTSGGLFTSSANVTLETDQWSGERYAWLWSVPVGTTNNVRLRGFKFYGPMYGDASQEADGRGWVTADELDCTSPHSGFGVPISAYGSGRWYFDVKKIKSASGKYAIDTAAPGSSTNAQIWVTAQKIESDTGFVNALIGEVWVLSQEFKFTGSSLVNGLASGTYAVVKPQYSISLKTNIAASTATLLVNLAPPMPGTNYTPKASFGFSGVTNYWFTALNRSNVTLNIQTGGSAGGAVWIEAKQNVQ
jgi:hypothetical protein